MTPEEQAKLRAPFDPTEVGKLPRVTCKDCRELSRQYRACDRHRFEKCPECGQRHTTGAMHLDYVGHAEVTDRLLDVDPGWSWEPRSPLEHAERGLWITLTICGTSRIGYGHAGEKKGGDAVKEVIGDAIRNAAMRFGVALDLWRKTDRADREGQHDVEPTPAVAVDEHWWVQVNEAVAEGDVPAMTRLGEQARAQQDDEAVKYFREKWASCVATAKANGAQA